MSGARARTTPKTERWRPIWSILPPRLRPWLGAAVGGVVVPLGWAPLYLFFLPIVGFYLLLATSAEARAPTRFFAGWLGGAICYGSAFHWVSFTMQEMSGLAPALSYLVVGVFGLWHGLVWGLFALLAEPARRLSPAAALLTLPSLWVLVEAVWPSVFPIYLGYVWGPTSPVVQISDLTGIAGPSFLTMSLAVAGVELERRRDAPWRHALRPVLVAAGLLVAAVVYGLARYHQIEGMAPAAELRLALVQPNPSIEEKRSESPVPRNGMLQRTLALTEPFVAQRDEIDAVIWPEGAFPWYLPDLDAALASQERVYRQEGARQVMRLQQRLGKDFVLGSLRRVRSPDGTERTRNSAVLVPANGGPTQTYDKVVLVPFGEYFPGSDLIPALKGAVQGISDLQAGDGYGHFALDGHDAFVTICYEAIYPGHVRAGLRDTDELILNLTNDVWFADSRALDLHLMGQIFRAVENRLPLVRATATGISVIVDATGRVLESTKKLELGVLTGTVPLRGAGSLYRRLGELFTWLVVGASVIVCAVGLRQQRRRRGTSA